MFRLRKLAFFVHGFTKSDKENLRRKELLGLRSLANEYLALDTVELASVHEVAPGLAEAGLMSKRTMRKFDEMCLTPVKEMTPEDIRALRLRERASQAVFARHLT